MKIRLLLLFFISISLVTILVSDDAPMEPAQSGNLLPAFNNDIQMKNERIDIHLHRNSYNIEVKYTFINTGKKQTITMGFPNVDKEGCYITSPINNFTAYDGKRKLDIYTKKADDSFYNLEEYSQILTPNNDDDFGMGSKDCNVFFECFDITFEQGETKTITNKYKQKYYINYGGFNRYLTYILKTGAYWKDNIELIEIFFHLDGLQISERTDQIFYDTYSFEYNDDYDINEIKENGNKEEWIFNPDEIVKIDNDLYNLCSISFI